MVRIKQTVYGVQFGGNYGKWEVIGPPFSRGCSRWYVVAKCGCGTIAVVDCYKLKQDISTHCCWCCPGPTPTHGDAARGSESRLYKVWRSMKQRCERHKNPNYKNYGGRGISVCLEWRESYSAFKAWALATGFADGLEIDRIDNDGNYEPRNCRWVSSKVNQRNKRTNRIVEAFGESKCLSEWAEDERCAVSRETLRQRLKAGWEHKTALTTAAGQ